MAGDNKPALIGLRERRAQVIEVLSEAFAQDALDMDEFDQRLTLAHQATNTAELDRLIDDVAPAITATEPDQEPVVATVEVPEPEAGLVPYRPEKKSVVTIIGGAERKGSWRVPKKLTAFALMGAIDLDFREVELPPGVTEVTVTAVMGAVDIIVPPWLAVECDGWALAGAFETMDRAPNQRDPNEPILVIKGRAVMGAFGIVTRLPGESSWQAYRRRRREAKQLRKQGEKKLADASRKQLSD